MSNVVDLTDFMARPKEPEPPVSHAEHETPALHTCWVCGRQTKRVDPTLNRCLAADGSFPASCIVKVGGHGAKVGRSILAAQFDR